MNSEIVINNFSGGLDNVSPINRMKMDSSPDCANFMFNRDGSIRKRLGYIQASATDQASKIVKIHDFVDRAGVESKLIVLASGAVKVLSGTTLSTYSANGEAITLPSGISQVDMNTTYIGSNDVVIATSGGIPRKIPNNTAVYTLLAESVSHIYCIEYVSATEIYLGARNGHLYKYTGLSTLTDLGTPDADGNITCIKYVDATHIYLGTNNSGGYGYWIYDGSTFAAVGAGGNELTKNVLCHHYVDDSNIYVGCQADEYLSSVWYWNGAVWASLVGTGDNVYGDVKDIYYVSASEIYVAGSGGTYNVGDGGTAGYLIKYTTLWNILGSGANAYNLQYVSSSEIYISTTEGLKKYTGTMTELVDGNYHYIVRASATEYYLWKDSGGSAEGKIKLSSDASTFSDLTNNGLTFTGVELSRIKYVNKNAIYLCTSLGLVKLSYDNLPKIFASNVVISGTVAATTPSKITLTAGATTNIHAGDYLNHASITEGIYVTSKDATAIYTSVNLSAATYTDIVVSQAPKAYYNEIYNDLMILGNIEYAGVRYPAQIAISETKENGGKEDFYGNSGLLNVLEFGTGEGDGITAIKSLNGRLIVWKRFSVFSLSMVDPRETETIYRQKISDKGCWCFGSVQKIPLPQGITACIYMNDEGFYLTDGTQCWQTPAMKKVYYAALVTNASLVTSAWDEDNDLYYVAFSTTGTINNIVLAYSPFMDAFMPIEYTHTNYTVSAFGIFNRALYHAEIYGSLAYLYQDNQNYGDAGAVTPAVGNAITYQWKTPLINLNVPKFLKEFRELCAEWKVKAADGTPSATMTVTINLYKNGSSSPDVILTDVNTNTTEALDNIQKKFSLKDRYCQLEITGGSARDILELHLIALKYKQIGVR